jgi:hypothetical protein
VKSIGKGGGGYFLKIRGLGRKTIDSFSCDRIFLSMVLRVRTLSWWFLLVQGLRICGAYRHFPIHRHGFLCWLSVICWRVTFQITKCETPPTNERTHRQIHTRQRIDTHVYVYSRYDGSMICTRHLVLWVHWQWKLMEMRTEFWWWNLMRNIHLENRGRKWQN